MKLSPEREVRIRPHLLLVLSSVYQIPERLREYDPNLFVVLNTVRNIEKAEGVPVSERTPFPPGAIPKWGAWYEIHSLAHKGNTFAMAVPYGELDARILRDVWSGDLRMRGKRIFREIDEHNERVEALNRRALRTQAEAIARELHRPFADAAWGDGGKTVFGPGSLAG